MEIRIGKAVFSTEPRFAEGHVLTAGEAQALNRTFVENVANNLRADVKKFFDENPTASTVSDELAAKFAEYADKYQFGERRERGAGAPRITDPVDREAINLIKDALRDQITARGGDVKQYTASAYNTKAAEILASPKGAEFKRRAREVIDARRSAASDLLGDLDLPVEAPATAADPAQPAAGKRKSKKENKEG